jgi:hypothetical protein
MPPGRKVHEKEHQVQSRAKNATRPKAFCGHRPLHLVLARHPKTFLSSGEPQIAGLGGRSTFGVWVIVQRPVSPHSQYYRPTRLPPVRL